jgi:hypothetical protein
MHAIGKISAQLSRFKARAFFARMRDHVFFTRNVIAGAFS